MKKLKIYLDTSVISYVYADDSPEKQSITQEFCERYLHDYDVYISELVLAEIEKTQDALLKEKFKMVVENYNLQIIEVDQRDEQAIYGLAQKYIRQGIIPPRKLDDAVHVAICVYYQFDVLLSWNFRHLSNINKQIAINAVNQKEGYLKDIFLLDPMEVIYEKD